MPARTLIDGVVFGGERLDFAAWPVLEGEGLEFTPPNGEYREGGYLDRRALLDVTDEHNAEYARLVEKTKQARRPEAEARMQLAHITAKNRKNKRPFFYNGTALEVS